MEAVQCERCGGAVAMVPGDASPTCRFCGAQALVPFDDLIDEEPRQAVPFRLSEAQAREAFEGFAKGSFWYPSELAEADVRLHRLFVPAWSFTGNIQLFWTALAEGNTKTGKRPMNGENGSRFEDVLVPASASLSQEEINGLGRFDERDLEPFEPDHAEAPYELGELSRRAATRAAREEMGRRLMSSLREERGLIEGSARYSVLPLGEFAGRIVLVPVWIGVYTWNEVPRRVLIHGRSGTVFGDAPWDWRKVVGAAVGGFLLVYILLLVLMAVAT